MGWIYKITSPSGKSYIGQTVRDDVRKRWTQEKNRPHGLLLYVFRKYGHGNCKFEKLFEVSYHTHGHRWEEFLDFWEKFEIEEQNTMRPYGYNSNSGGKNCKYHSAVRKHLSILNTGKRATEHTKHKMSIARIGEKNHFFNKKHSKESLKKMSIAKKGKPSGRRVTDEQKRKTKNTREKNKNKYEYASGSRNPHSVAIDKFTMDDVFVESFESILQAAKSIGICDVGIRNCLKGKGKQSGGFIWKKRIMSTASSEPTLKHKTQ